MASHGFSRPDDTSTLPVWLNYVLAEANAACVGLIPPHTFTIRVRLSDDGWTITLEFLLIEVAPEDLEDIDTISDRFCTRIADRDGGQLNVTRAYAIFDPLNPVDTLQANNPGRVYGLYSLNHRLDN